MHRRSLLFGILMSMSAVALDAQQAPVPPPGPGGRAGAPAGPPMVLSSTAFADATVIPDRHTQVQQAERGISPALSWTNAPAATETRRNLFKAMDGHVIGKAVMVGLFKRSK